jgi:hypothetical protein
LARRGEWWCWKVYEEDDKLGGAVAKPDETADRRRRCKECVCEVVVKRKARLALAAAGKDLLWSAGCKNGSRGVELNGVWWWFVDVGMEFVTTAGSCG